jgi:hypothetical protein
MEESAVGATAVATACALRLDSVSIVGTEELVDVAGRSFTGYVISAAQSERVWLPRRRFKELRAFHQAVCEAVGESSAPGFPPKLSVASVFEGRQAKLERFLQECNESRAPAACKMLQEFLGARPCASDLDTDDGQYDTASSGYASDATDGQSVWSHSTGVYSSSGCPSPCSSLSEADEDE